MKNVLIFIPKGFELFEASAFADVFGWAKDVEKLEIQACFCGISNEVIASFGHGEKPHIVKPSILVDEIKIDDYDALALPGGFGKYGYFEEGFDERTLNLVRGFEAQKKPVAGVCTAALVLAKSGILNNRKATVYKRDNGMYVRQLKGFGVDVCDEEIVISDNVITSSGPQTAPFVALRLLEILTSEDAARNVAIAMGFDN